MGHTQRASGVYFITLTVKGLSNERKLKVTGRCSTEGNGHVRHALDRSSWGGSTVSLRISAEGDVVVDTASTLSTLGTVVGVGDAALSVGPVRCRCRMQSSIFIICIGK